MTYMGIESKNECVYIYICVCVCVCVCVCITDLLYGAAETNTAF